MANLVNSHVLGIHLLGQYFRPKKTQTQKIKEFWKVCGSLVPFQYGPIMKNLTLTFVHQSRLGFAGRRPALA